MGVKGLVLTVLNPSPDFVVDCLYALFTFSRAGVSKWL